VRVKLELVNWWCILDVRESVLVDVCESVFVDVCESVFVRPMGWLREQAPSNCRSLSQNISSFIGLFCKRDL